MVVVCNNTELLPLTVYRLLNITFRPSPVWKTAMAKWITLCFLVVCLAVIILTLGKIQNILVPCSINLTDQNITEWNDKKCIFFCVFTDSLSLRRCRQSFLMLGCVCRSFVCLSWRQQPWEWLSGHWDGYPASNGRENLPGAKPTRTYASIDMDPGNGDLCWLGQDQHVAVSKL